MNNTSLNIIQWNAQSLRPKLTEFDLLLSQEKIHIALVSETWLEPESHLNISGYNIFRKDRADAYGGIALIVHKSIKVQEYSMHINNLGIQCKCLKMLNCNYLRNVILVYCPSSVSTVQSDWDYIFSRFPRNSLIAGDFNAHHTNWSYKNDTRGLKIFDSALEYGYTSLNNGQVTRLRLVNGRLQKSSPDITFASADLAVNFNWNVISESLGSDHLVIKISTHYQEPAKISKKRNFKLADWDTYNKFIENNLHFPVGENNIQDIYDNFIKEIQKALHKSVPFTKSCNNPNTNFKPKPYWTPILSNLVAQRRRALSTFRRNPTPHNLQNLEKRIEEAKKAIRRARSENWQNYCSSIDESTTASEMWSRMRWMKGFRKSKHIFSDENKEQMLKKLAPDFVLPKVPKCESTNMQLESEITYHELNNVLKKKDTAPGADGITYSMIYHLPMQGKLYLLKLYNLILELGCVPNQWRDIKIIPIPKPQSDPNAAPSIRPISLISCLCKTFHLILGKRLEWFVEKNSLLDTHTTGFRRGQSCLDCLARLVTHIQIGFSKNVSTVACFLDIDGAYNNVLIDRLVNILDEWRIGKSICNYIWNFLTERYLKITDECDSNKVISRCTSKGLAQGDPMSPLLFNVATAKICNDIKNVFIGQYADDFVLYTSGSNMQDSAYEIQVALNALIVILNTLGLELSEKKSKLCIFSRKRRLEHIELEINESSLALDSSYKYLGIWLDKSLRWARHINEIYDKILKFMNLLKVLAGGSWGVHPKHLRRIYIALIRSRLDYGCFLYDNSANSNLSKLDKAQNQALRIVGGFVRSTPIHTMESEICMPPLYLRRKYLAYKYCLKAKSLTNNETITLLNELSSLNQTRYWINKKSNLLVIAVNESKDEKIFTSNPIQMFTLNTWVSNIKIEGVIETKLDNVRAPKRFYEGNSLKCSVIEELHRKYGGWYIIFTDGSKNSVGNGAAFYDPNKPASSNSLNCFKIVENVCIMSLELTAISQAITYLQTIAHRRVVICTDSKSALFHLARCASGGRGVPIAYEILAKVVEMQDSGSEIILQWVPSHVGLRGNEEADILAKRASLEGKEINILPDFGEALHKYKIKCHCQWKEYFDKRSREKGIWYKSIQCEPPRIPWFYNTNLNRNNIVLAHRLRTGHIPLNKYGFLMKKVNSPNCDTCGKIEDVQHLLVECERNRSQREALLTAANFSRYDVGVFISILSDPTSELAKKVYRMASRD